MATDAQLSFNDMIDRESSCKDWVGLTIQGLCFQILFRIKSQITTSLNSVTTDEFKIQFFKGSDNASIKCNYFSMKQMPYEEQICICCILLNHNI